MTPAEGVTEEITPGTPPPPSNGSIPSNLKENILQFPNTMNDAATGNDELRALYVSQFPDGKINSQSIGLNPKEITSISSTLLQAIEATIKPFKPSKMIVAADSKEKWVLGNSKENTVLSDQ